MKRTDESKHHEDGRSTKSTAAEVTEFDSPRQSSVVAGGLGLANGSSRRLESVSRRVVVDARWLDRWERKGHTGKDRENERVRR